MLFCNNRYSWSPSLVHKAEVSPRHIFQLDSHKRSKNHGIAVRKTLTREIFEILDFEEKLDLLDLNSFQFYNIPKIDLLMYIYKAVFRILWLIWGNRFSRTLTGLKKQILRINPYQSLLTFLFVSKVHHLLKPIFVDLDVIWVIWNNKLVACCWAGVNITVNSMEIFLNTNQFHFQIIT